MLTTFQGLGYTPWWQYPTYQQRRYLGQYIPDDVEQAAEQQQEQANGSTDSSTTDSTTDSGNGADDSSSVQDQPEVIYNDVIETPLVTGVLPDQFQRWLIDTGRAPRPVVSTYVPSTGPLFDTRIVELPATVADWLKDDSLTEFAPNWAVLATGVAAAGAAIYFATK